MSLIERVNCGLIGKIISRDDKSHESVIETTSASFAESTFVSPYA